MKTALIIIIIFSLNVCYLYSQNFEDILLSDIIKNAEKYNNKKIILKLRLKNIDNIFNKIIFYDRKNYDIIFDIYELKKKKEFRKQSLNIREGLEYIVEFLINVKNCKNGKNKTF